MCLKCKCLLELACRIKQSSNCQIVKQGSLGAGNCTEWQVLAGLLTVIFLQPVNTVINICLAKNVLSGWCEGGTNLWLVHISHMCVTFWVDEVRAGLTSDFFMSNCYIFNGWNKGGANWWLGLSHMTVTFWVAEVRAGLTSDKVTCLILHLLWMKWGWGSVPMHSGNSSGWLGHVFHMSVWKFKYHVCWAGRCSMQQITTTTTNE